MRIVVGRVGRAHGVRGDVGVEVRTDDPDVRFAAGSVLFTAEDGPTTVTVERSRWHSGRLLVGFAGVSDRTAAEDLRGLLLYRLDADRVEEEGAWYDHDLIGCAVRSGGEIVGEVEDVGHPPAQDLLHIRLATGQLRLVPLVRELVPEVDIDARIITVEDRPGLLADLPADEG